MKESEKSKSGPGGPQAGGGVKYAYYPGCSLHSTSFEYDRSFREVCAALNIELEEIPDWTCCGASSAHQVSRLLAISLPVSNMLKAKEAGHEEMLVPCAACFSRLKTAEHEMAKDPKTKAEVEEILGKKTGHAIKITHPLEIIEKIAASKDIAIKKKSGIKVACYYGCLLTKPPKVTGFDNCEYPMSMDNILRKFGFETLDWSYKTDCCGAAFGISDPAIVKKLIRKILDNAIELGAEAIAVACPLCHTNLDVRQPELGDEKYKIPILYFTQLMGLAMEIPTEKLAVSSHLTQTDTILKRV